MTSPTLTTVYTPGYARFFDASSGAFLLPDLFYGFSDSGGVFDRNGRKDSETLVAEITEELLDRNKENLPTGTVLELKDFISTDPTDLGSVHYVVMTGEQFVQRLLHLESMDNFVFRGKPEVRIPNSLEGWGYFELPA